MHRKPQKWAAHLILPAISQYCRQHHVHIYASQAKDLPRHNCRWQFVKCLTSGTSSAQFGKLSWIFCRCLSGDTTRCQVIFIFRVMTRFKKQRQQEVSVPVKSLTRSIRKITATPQNKSKIIARLLNSSNVDVTDSINFRIFEDATTVTIVEPNVTKAHVSITKSCKGEMFSNYHTEFRTR